MYIGSSVLIVIFNRKGYCDVGICLALLMILTTVSSSISLAASVPNSTDSFVLILLHASMSISRKYSGYCLFHSLGQL